MASTFIHRLLQHPERLNSFSVISIMHFQTVYPFSPTVLEDHIRGAIASEIVVERLYSCHYRAYFYDSPNKDAVEIILGVVDKMEKRTRSLADLREPDTWMEEENA